MAVGRTVAIGSPSGLGWIFLLLAQTFMGTLIAVPSATAQGSLGKPGPGPTSDCLLDFLRFSGDDAGVLVRLSMLWPLSEAEHGKWGILADFLSDPPSSSTRHEDGP